MRLWARSASRGASVEEALRNILASTKRIVVGVNKGKKDGLRVFWSYGVLTLVFTVEDFSQGAELRRRLLDIASDNADQLLRIAQFSRYGKITGVAGIVLSILFSVLSVVASGNDTVYSVLLTVSAALIVLGAASLRNATRINKLEKEDPQRYARIKQQAVDIMTRIITAVPLDTAAPPMILIEDLGFFQVKRVKKHWGKRLRIELVKTWTPHKPFTSTLSSP